MGDFKKKWFRMPEKFFDSIEIRKINLFDDGDKIIVLYLKMMCLSLFGDGHIFHERVGISVQEEISLILSEKLPFVIESIDTLIDIGLIKKSNNDLFFTQFQILTGPQSESYERVRKHRESKKEISAGAMRVRKCRAKKKAEKLLQKNVTCNTETVTCNAENVTCNAENNAEFVTNVTPVDNSGNKCNDDKKTVDNHIGCYSNKLKKNDEILKKTPKNGVTALHSALHVTLHVTKNGVTALQNETNVTPVDNSDFHCNYDEIEHQKNDESYSNVTLTLHSNENLRKKEKEKKEKIDKKDKKDFEGQGQEIDRFFLNFLISKTHYLAETDRELVNCYLQKKSAEYPAENKSAYLTEILKNLELNESGIEKIRNELNKKFATEGFLNCLEKKRIPKNSDEKKFQTDVDIFFSGAYELLTDAEKNILRELAVESIKRKSYTSPGIELIYPERLIRFEMFRQFQSGTHK